MLDVVYTVMYVHIQKCEVRKLDVVTSPQFC